MDGDLQANANTGDWVPGSGSGGAVLGTNGMPVNPTTTFHLVDGFGAAENNFNGGLKVDNDPNLWTWVINPTTGKDDINHALIHISTASDGHRWLVVSADRAKNNGDSYVDFEFLQNSLSITTNADGLTGGFVSAGPHGGRTTNDFLLTISFTRGGTTPGVCLERWLPAGTGFDYVDAPLPAGFVFGAVNTAVIPVPYGAFGGTTYDVNTFAEVAVDVTAMMAGFDRCLSVGVKSMMVKTKTSQSPQASIVDFITPLSIDLKLGPSADAGPDQAKCSAGASTTFTLDGKAYAGLDPIISTNWSVVSGSATIDSTNSLSTAVHVIGASATLRLTLTTAVEGGCAKSDDVVLTVNQPPACSITGTAPVCPSSTNTYSAPAGMDTYSWSISGNGTIVGSTSLQEIAVAAGSACNQDFTLTLTITKNGCPSTCSQNFLVRDITPPVISAAGADATINCPSTPVFTPPTATDTCDANPQIVEVSDVTTPGTCAGAYTRTKTWKAVDACGNESGTQSQTINMRDNIPPVISDAGANATIECPNTPVFTAPTATDACDSNPQVIEVSDVTTPGTCAGSYSRTKTWKAVDACGNASGLKSQTITVHDTTSPVISNAGANATIDCPRTPVFTPPTATDACDAHPQIIEVSDVTTPGTCAGTYTRTKTWKAVDACGNESGMKSQSITVRDNSAPEITEAGPEETIDCPSTPVFTSPTATDACDSNPRIVEVSDVTTPGAIAGTYTRTKTWKAVDACGNESGPKSQTITVRDNTAPVINDAGANATIDCPGTPAFTPPTATDVCDPNPRIVEISDITTPGTCAGSYTRTKTWKAVDASGNESGIKSQTITVRDNTAPVLGTPGANATIDCPNTPVFTPPTATDACDPNPRIIEVSDVATPGSCSGSYTRTKTWKAVDACGNESGTQSQTITVRDNTAPAISDAGANATIDCPNTPVFAPPTATDACDPNPQIIEINDVTTPGTCAGSYTRTKTWKAVDSCGNESGTKSQAITVRDNTAPAIGDAGADATIDCPRTPVFTPPTATDACDSNPRIVEVSDVTTPGSCAGTYTRTKTWKVVDACGNESGMKSQTITVRDNTAPEISEAGAEETIDCPTTPVFTPPTATDACDPNPGIVEVSDVTTPGLVAGSYTRTKTWKAMDACGNGSETKSQTITIRDSTAPVIGDAGADATIDCPNTPVFTPPTATDACDSTPRIVEISDVTTPGACAGSYTRTKTWKAVDAAGNESGTKSQTITVQDKTAPVLGNPGANTTIECSNTPAFTPPTATDACDANPQIVEVSDVTTPGTCAGSYTRTKTWKAVDACGNESGTRSQTITVRDTTAPTISDAGANATIDCPNTPVFTPPTASDACDANPQLIEVSDVTTPGSCAGSYTRTKTWKAVDACGNASGLKSQTITVHDTTAPFIGDAGANATIDCSTTPVFTPPTATDACDANPRIDEVSDVTTPGTCTGSYTRTKTWKAVDACGNESGTKSQTITVTDSTAPVITCPPNSRVAWSDSTATNATGVATATDSCDPNPLIIYADTEAPGDCPNTKVITRTWTASDSCGNAASCAQKITVGDITPPTLQCPPTATVECNSATDPTVTGRATATSATGAVLTPSYSDSFAPGTCPNTKVITRTWTATDICGNTASCAQTINVVDSTAPRITCPADMTVDCSASTDPSATGSASATDNCDPNPTINHSDAATGVCPKIITRTWTATDCAGQTSSCTQKITIVDTTPPVITCPPDKTLEEHTSADPIFTGRATAIDNCDPAPTISYSDVTNGVSIRIITRTWTATDCAGNQSKCVQTITVPDSLSGGNFLTDTMRCTLPGNQLRLIFTPDTKNMPCYKLNASNPGQFYYNVFYAGMPGESETFNVTLPYPWVTQGANPIEVYDGVTLRTSGGQTCLTPGRKVYAGSQQVTLASYGTKPVMGVSTHTLIITVTVPASGYVYLAIHLDFGLKASTGYNRNASDDATACANTAAILVPNNQSYTFSVAGEDNASATVSSYNAFKKNPGVGGLTQSLSTTFSVPGAAATLRDTRGLVLGTGVTDQDGWYLINYKATGKAATYSLTLTPPKGSGAAQKQAITLKSNGYVEADFTTP
jgi:hypothetical protein